MASYSTLADAKAAYLANADYADGGGDLAKAQAFRTACRALLLLLPQQTQQGTQMAMMNLLNLKAELDRAEVWIAARTQGRIVYADVRTFRDYPGLPDTRDSGIPELRP